MAAIKLQDPQYKVYFDRPALFLEYTAEDGQRKRRTMPVRAIDDDQIAPRQLADELIQHHHAYLAEANHVQVERLLEKLRQARSAQQGRASPNPSSPPRQEQPESTSTVQETSSRSRQPSHKARSAESSPVGSPNLSRSPSSDVLPPSMTSTHGSGLATVAATAPHTKVTFAPQDQVDFEPDFDELEDEEPKEETVTPSPFTAKPAALKPLGVLGGSIFSHKPSPLSPLGSLPPLKSTLKPLSASSDAKPLSSDTSLSDGPKTSASDTLFTKPATKIIPASSPEPVVDDQIDEEIQFSDNGLDKLSDGSRSDDGLF